MKYVVKGYEVIRREYCLTVEAESEDAARDKAGDVFDEIISSMAPPLENFETPHSVAITEDITESAISECNAVAEAAS